MEQYFNRQQIFNNSNESFVIYCDYLSSIDICRNLIIESSYNSVELISNSSKSIIFDGIVDFSDAIAFNKAIYNNIDILNISELSTKFLKVNSIIIPPNVLISFNSVNNGYIRNTMVGYDIDGIGRSNAYFTYINVSGEDSNFSDSLYIKNNLNVRKIVNISNDLIIDGTSFLSIDTSFNSYKQSIEGNFYSANILTNDLSATNISISNDLYVHKTAFLNNVLISGQLLNNVLKVPTTFTIDPSGYNNNSGTLIINGDLIVKGISTTFSSSIVEISDVAITIASKILNILDLSLNNAGLDISNIASLKYNGTTWNFSGGQLFVENNKVCLDASLIETINSLDLSFNTLNTDFSSSFLRLKKNIDNSYNATYTRNEMINSFKLKYDSDSSLNYLKNYLDISYVSKQRFDGSFNALKTYIDASYLVRNKVLGSQTNATSLDISLSYLASKLDSSYVLNNIFEGSYNNLKQKFDSSFTTINVNNIDASSITIETINTKHFSQRFNNMLWNQLGQDITNGLPSTNNNNKIAISNDGKVVAMSSSSHTNTSKGRVYVYEISYNQISYNLTPLGLSGEILVGVSNDDQFGWDIALSSDGKVVAGSSILNDSSGVNSGQVRVFELSNNIWRQKGNNINGSNINSESGYSISLAGNGNSIAVGAWKDNSNGTNAGAVRVYDFSNINNISDWRQKGLTVAGIAGSYEGYSCALSLDGLTLASGSPNIGISVSGSNITTNKSYTIESFTTVGTSTFTPTFNGTVEVLIVGGGGGGGSYIGGGGGGGGVIYMPEVTVTSGTAYSIVVGAGGGSATDGSFSSAFGAIAAGGGTSGDYGNNTFGRSGGSGGGAPATETILNRGGVSSGNSLGTNKGTVYGNRGGHMARTRLGDQDRAAGGGGAGGAAVDTDPRIIGNTGQTGAGSGGIGIMNPILGPNHYWGGGGGGGAYSGQVGGWGGLGGGGGGCGWGGGGTGGTSALNSGSNGSAGSSVGGAGGPNTGGGGGGGVINGVNGGGTGGSGIVIIRYLTSSTITNPLPFTKIGQVKTFTWSGTTWIDKGTIRGPDISGLYFGRSIKLSGNGNNIIIGAPEYDSSSDSSFVSSSVIVYAATTSKSYEMNNDTTKTWDEHRREALTIPYRSLASILSESENTTVKNLIASGSAFIGGTRTANSVANGKSSSDWYWTNGDPWVFEKFYGSEPNNAGNAEPIIEMYSDGLWNDHRLDLTRKAVYMNKIRPEMRNITITTSNNPTLLNLGQAYVYEYQGGTWRQLGQAITGAVGSDEFGSSVAISNDGTTISVGGRYSADNNSRCNVKVFKYYNNYWYQLGQTINGSVNNSILALNHALSGDGTTLFHNLGNQYSRVYGINKGFVIVSPTTTITTTISGDLLVGGRTSFNSLKISNKYVFDTSGYSSNYLASSDPSASIVDYYSDVGYTYNKVFKIDTLGNVSNYSGIYGSISDSRLKENIVSCSPKLEDLLKVRVVNYTLKNSDSTKYIGVLAQELEELFPELIIEDGTENRLKAVKYSSLSIMLIKAFQEQQMLINNLITTLEELEN